MSTKSNDDSFGKMLLVAVLILGAVWILARPSKKEHPGKRPKVQPQERVIVEGLEPHPLLPDLLVPQSEAHRIRSYYGKNRRRWREFDD